MEENALGIAVMAIYLLFILFYLATYALAMLASLGSYILIALSQMKIAKKLGVKNGFLAFIPYANTYLIGKIAEKNDEIYHPEKKSAKWSIILLVNQIAGAILLIAEMLVMYAVILFPLLLQNSMETVSEMPPLVMIGMIITGVTIILTLIAYFVIYYIGYYKVYHAMAGKHAWWMLLLTILCSPYAEIVIQLVLAFSKKFPILPQDEQSSPTVEIPQEEYVSASAEQN